MYILFINNGHLSVVRTKRDKGNNSFQRSIIIKIPKKIFLLRVDKGYFVCKLSTQNHSRKISSISEKDILIVGSEEEGLLKIAH